MRASSGSADVPATNTLRAPTIRESLRLLTTERFGTFWIASLLSNLGTWAQQVAEPWLLLTLGASQAGPFIEGVESDHQRSSSSSRRKPALVERELLAGVSPPWLRPKVRVSRDSTGRPSRSKRHRGDGASRAAADRGERSSPKRPTRLGPPRGSPRQPTARGPAPQGASRTNDGGVRQRFELRARRAVTHLFLGRRVDLAGGE